MLCTPLADGKAKDSEVNTGISQIEFPLNFFMNTPKLSILPLHRMAAVHKKQSS
jgi:hypothetical protein